MNTFQSYKYNNILNPMDEFEDEIDLLDDLYEEVKNIYHIEINGFKEKSRLDETSTWLENEVACLPAFIDEFYEEIISPLYANNV